MKKEQPAFDLVESSLKELDALKEKKGKGLFSINLYYDNLSIPGEFVFKVIEFSDENKPTEQQNKCFYFRSRSFAMAYYKCREYFNGTKFLQQGLGIGESLSSKFERRRLINRTHPDFINWMDQQLQNGIIKTTQVTVLNKEYFLDNFLNNSLYYKHSRKIIGLTTFTRWLNKWCDSYGFILDSTNRGIDGMMAYRFKRKPFKIETQVRKMSADTEFVENLLYPGYRPLKSELPF